MNFTTYIGIDVSKLTLDFCVYDQVSRHFIRIENSSDSIENIFETDLILKQLRKTKAFFCIEQTGIYSNLLIQFLQKKKYHFAVPSALHIKYSIGLTRAKTDKLDAERIAVFASKNVEELRQWIPQREIIDELQALVRLLKKLKTVKGIFKNRLTEGGKFLNRKIHGIVYNHCIKTVEAIEKDIHQIELDIDTIIQSDNTLKRLYQILCSVRGVGPVLAHTLIVLTNEFKKFPGPNQFACYAGIAPFERSSGTSLNKKARISRLANHEIKSLLHIAAMSAIRSKTEYKLYFDRKVEQNKPKMLILNAIRNKIIKRVFCCVRENRLYENRIK
ncbi:MAG: IS110 family transposase [Filimonas sp.]|nr:IS110 family transposase [Filimonas sp.]